jgi:hypothetical protein
MSLILTTILKVGWNYYFHFTNMSKKETEKINAFPVILGLKRGKTMI